MAELRFDEGQSAEILQRAAQLQEGDAAPGATLAELQAIAAEVGLDPKLVEQAADEVNSKLLAPATSAQGVITLFERTTNCELSPAAWEDIVTALRSYTGKAGEASQSGATCEWQGLSDSVELTLTATVRTGRTRFRLVADASGANSTWFKAGAVGTVVGGPMTFGLAGGTHLWGIAALCGLATISVSIGATRLAARRSRERIKSELANLIDAIAEIGSR